jgi:uncharacterized protein
MFLLDDKVVLSASDVARESACDFATLRALDVALGRVEVPPPGTDPMLQLLARLGEEHEKRYLDSLKSSREVVEIPPPTTYDRASLETSHRATLAALRDGKSVVYQASLFDGEFYGRADFIVSEGIGEEQCYVVHDTKLARRAKVNALLQLASYVDLLAKAGIPVSRDAVLDLGNGENSRHNLRDITPVYLERRTRLTALLEAHRRLNSPVTWADESVQRCGRCDVCVEEIAASRDVLLVARMTRNIRRNLHSAGVRTIEDLANLSEEAKVSGVSVGTLSQLRAQATLQLRQDSEGYNENGRPHKVFFEVFNQRALRSLPVPDGGDVYFDFEGDPLWSDDNPREFGLEYLFGLEERVGLEESEGWSYRWWWAHDRKEEHQALIDFLSYIKDRRAKSPAMHVYHYAPYERTALARLCARYSEGGDYLDELLREGVFVDLYATVRQSIRISQPSYSLKKLEPLFMKDERPDDLNNAVDSIIQYALACEQRQGGDEKGYSEALDLIKSYNQYDCRATRELHAWLLQRREPTDDSASGADVEDGAKEAGSESPARHRDVARDAEKKLQEKAEDGSTPEEDRRAIRMVGAAMTFFEREEKPFWREHLSRLSGDLDEFSSTKDVLVPDHVDVTEWELPPKKRSKHRSVTLKGRFPDGSTVAALGNVHLLYEEPPEWMRPPAGAIRAAHSRATVIKVDDGNVVIDEWLPNKGDGYTALPVAVAPGPPLSTTIIELTLLELGGQVLQDGLYNQPALDIVRRRPSRYLDNAEKRPVIDGDVVTAITLSVENLNHSYLAVQGPPGTGKTRVGAGVIKNLIEKGWKIGVVAQSHAVVNNLLQALINAGVDKTRIAKKSEDGDKSKPWEVIKPNEAQSFLEKDGGRVLGGTAWTMSNKKHIGSESLDLLVIDEAGQFSLAVTLAVSQSTTRLLLLGDPQQLPQVSQGSHPEPVDSSALAWLCGTSPTLPPEFGYFLGTSYRMHPELCTRVSRLSYLDQLNSDESTTRNRSLEDLAPGVHVRTLDHTGNSVLSVEEADEVVKVVDELVGLKWTTGDETRCLGPDDILVVAAYNAQVNEIKRKLIAAGRETLRVGTVDNFQGQEAPIVIVSMAASSVDDVPRGMSFLLSRNRINVAVSRAQWAAIVLRSAGLTNHLPTSISDVEELGAFLALLSPPQ